MRIFGTAPLGSSGFRVGVGVPVRGFRIEHLIVTVLIAWGVLMAFGQFAPKQEPVRRVPNVAYTVEEYVASDKRDCSFDATRNMWDCIEN
jgi:hypothetical protein